MKIGDKAPDFKLMDKDNNEVTLSQFRGKKVILYFYPKDNTPGCTKQACNFRDNYPQIVAKGAEVIGISKDSAKTHRCKGNRGLWGLEGKENVRKDLPRYRKNNFLDRRRGHNSRYSKWQEDEGCYKCR